MKNEVIQEFHKLAESCDARLIVEDTFCEFSKNGIALRARWSIDRITGLFVTLGKEAEEYGLPYLVEFMDGTAPELAVSSSDSDLKGKIEVVKKYALPFLMNGQATNFLKFSEFMGKRLRKVHAEIEKEYGWFRKRFNR